MTVTPRLAFLLTLPPLMWAGNAVLGRIMVGQVPPLTLNFMRWTMTVVFLLPLGWRVLKRLDLVRERLGWLALVSLLGMGLYNALQYLALVTSTPLNVTLVASSLPVWMLLVGFLFHGERLTRRQLLGASLGLSGVLLVIGRGSWATLTQVNFVAGDLAMLGAVIGWAFYSWQLARPPTSMRGDRRPGPAEGWDWAGLLLLQALIGCVPAGLFSAAELAAGAQPIRWSWQLWATLVFVSLGASVVAYRCWGLGVAQAGPAVTAFFGNLTPLFAAVLGALVLGEAPQPYHGIAFGLIIAGIAVNSLGRPTR